MKKLVFILLAGLSLTANAQTTQGTNPDLVSNICAVTYEADQNGNFHWYILWQKAVSPTVDHYVVEVYNNGAWALAFSQPANDVSIRDLDNVLWDTASYFQVRSEDVALNTIFTSGAHKPMFIEVQESASHAVVFFDQYVGFDTEFYLIRRGTAMDNLVAYDSVAVGISSQQYFDPEAGTFDFYYYQVEAVRSGTCTPTGSPASLGARSNIVKNGLSNVSEQALLNNINLYPNPAQSTLNIDLGKAATGTISVTILNSVGQVVTTKAFDKTAGQKLSLDIAGLPTGLYTAQVNTFGGTKAVRVVKE